MFGFALSRLEAVLVAGGVCLVFAACAPAAEESDAAPAAESTPSETAQADAEAVRAVVDAEVAAANAGDPEAFISILTDDVVIAPPGQPIVTGTDAHQWIRDFMAVASIELESYEDVDLDVTGDRAIHVYEFSWTVTPADGDPVRESGQGIHVLRRAADGTWRISHDIWNAGAAPSM